MTSKINKVPPRQPTPFYPPPRHSPSVIATACSIDPRHPSNQTPDPDWRPRQLKFKLFWYLTITDHDLHRLHSHVSIFVQGSQISICCAVINLHLYHHANRKPRCQSHDSSHVKNLRRHSFSHSVLHPPFPRYQVPAFEPPRSPLFPSHPLALQHLSHQMTPMPPPIHKNLKITHNLNLSLPSRPQLPATFPAHCT